MGNKRDKANIIRNGLVPGGAALRRGRQATYFSAVSSSQEQISPDEDLGAAAGALPPRTALERPAHIQITMRPETNSNDFGGFLEFISRFEFEFRRCGFFFERFEFLVCSKFNHTQCGRTCACAVACLCQHNSIIQITQSPNTRCNAKFIPEIRHRHDV